MLLRYLIGISILFYFTSPVYATIYKWTDEKGEVHFTDDQKKIPEKHKENAKDFDKIEKQGSVTYDPTFGTAEEQKSGKEPFWKRFLREEEKQAKKAVKPKVVLYMADW